VDAGPGCVYSPAAMSEKQLRSHASTAASAAGLVLLLLAAAGSKPSGATADADAGTTTTTSAEDETEPKVSVSGKKVPNFEYIRGTCDMVAREGKCDEFYGIIPKFTPDDCKKEGGTFTTSFPKPRSCPKEKLIGTCHYEQNRSGEAGQFVNFYSTNGSSAAALKADCLEGLKVGSKVEWIDAPAAPAPAVSAPAAKAATPSKNAAPAKAPAKGKEGKSK
jgi:hypothetical protein